MTTLQTAGAAMDSADALKETIAQMAIEIERKNALLAEALKLLKRTPRVTRDMYIGRDSNPWGVLAADMAKAIDKELAP